jgi:DNA segregation ATPase FtsK/SpoIIIE-like protein
MITHYLATHPNFLPLAFMGFTVALGLNLWGSVKGQGCLIVPLYLYVFGVWFFVCITFFLSAPHGQEGFMLGFALYHSRTVFEWVSGALFWMIKKNRQWKEAEDRAKEEKAWEERQKQQYQQQQSHQHQQYQQEQARREQEARQYREQQERAKREQERQERAKREQGKKQEQKQKSPPKQEQAKDTRSFAEILGISSGYTQEELKKAYQREAQRTHPDKWVGKPAHIQAIMEAEYKAVQEAYDKLRR